MIEPKMLPQRSQQSALELRLAKKILTLNPGMGEKSQAIAESLVDSGMNAAGSAMIIHAVYAPTDPQGRGQATRARWFVEAVRRRYSYKLEKIRNDPSQFRNFLSEMEEVVEMRDILNGEGVAVSFEAAFLLWEIGLTADSAMGILQETCDDMNYLSIATKHLIRAAQAVKNGHFLTIENAIDSMRYGYEYERPTN